MALTYGLNFSFNCILILILYWLLPVYIYIYIYRWAGIIFKDAWNSQGILFSHLRGNPVYKNYVLNSIVVNWVPEIIVHKLCCLHLWHKKLCTADFSQNFYKKFPYRVSNHTVHFQNATIYAWVIKYFL